MEGRSDKGDQEAWFPGISIQDYVIKIAGDAREHTNSGEARERCSTQMTHQQRGVHHVVRFIHI